MAQTAQPTTHSNLISCNTHLAACLERMRESDGTLSNYVVSDLIKSLIGAGAAGLARPALDAIRSMYSDARQCVSAEDLVINLMPPAAGHHGFSVTRGAVSTIVVVVTGDIVEPSERAFTRKLLGNFEREASEEELEVWLESRADTIAHIRIYTTRNPARTWEEIIKPGSSWSRQLLAKCHLPYELEAGASVRGSVNTGTIDGWHAVFSLIERAMDALGHGDAYRAAADAASTRKVADLHAGKGLESYRAAESACAELMRLDHGIPGAETRRFFKALETQRMESSMHIWGPRLPGIVAMLKFGGHVGGLAQATYHADGRVRSWFDTAATDASRQAIAFQSQHGTYVALLSANPPHLRICHGAPSNAPDCAADIARRAPWATFVHEGEHWKLTSGASIELDSIRAWSDFESLVASSHCSLTEDLAVREAVASP